MIEVFCNTYSGRWVARIGGLPIHLGGRPGDYDPAMPPRLLTGEDGKIRQFDTEQEAWAAAEAAG